MTDEETTLLAADYWLCPCCYRATDVPEWHPCPTCGTRSGSQE